MDRGRRKNILLGRGNRIYKDLDNEVTVWFLWNERQAPGRKWRFVRAERKTEMRDHQGPYTTSLVTIYAVRKRET